MAVLESPVITDETGQRIADALESMSTSEAVKYTQQTLTDAQKEQARENIGAVEAEAGKGLSTNDYTNTDKGKVDQIDTIKNDLTELTDSVGGLGNAIGMHGWNQQSDLGNRIRNSTTDTRDFLIFRLISLDSVDVIWSLNIESPQKVESIFTASASCDRMYVYHNGSSQNIIFGDIKGTISGHKYFISANVVSANPTVVNGIDIQNFNFIDLTALFGTDNEPTSVEQFRQMFPAEYYPYEIPNSMISDAWDSTKTYFVGEYCIYQNQLYKCLTQHSNVAPHNASYWSKTSVGGEIENTNRDLTELRGRTKIVLIAQGINTTTTLSYSGISVNIPANSSYELQFEAVFSNSLPTEIVVSDSDSTTYPWNLYSHSDTQHRCSVCGFTSNALTLYLWTKYADASLNAVRVNGTYTQF